MIRTYDQAEVDEFAAHATIPVINALTEEAHPLQALADAMTIRERFGRLDGIRLTYLGDGNNVCASLMRIAGRFGMHFVAACPAGLRAAGRRRRRPRGPTPSATVAASRLTSHPTEACEGADVLYTDVWVSMGQDGEREQRLHDLDRFALDGELLAMAAPGAISMHCLPAHEGEEISTEALYGPQSARVGPGGEPPPHAEGRDGARHPMRFEASRSRASSPSSRPSSARRSRTSPS